MKAVAMYYWKPQVYGKPLPPSTTIGSYIGRILHKGDAYNQYGLYHDDVLYHWPDVAEAVRRIPAEVYNARTYRIVRAIQLDIQRIRLPREQWITYEEDLAKGRYLQPYLDEIRKEIKERDEWNATH